jgi:hypothetical protein
MRIRSGCPVRKSSPPLKVCWVTFWTNSVAITRASLVEVDASCRRRLRVRTSLSREGVMVAEMPIWRYDIIRSGPSCRVALGGEADLESAARVQDILLEELDRPGTDAVEADMSAVDFCDSTGLAAHRN